MSEKAAAECLFTTLEYRAIFENPIFSAFEKPTSIADILYHAFLEWNPAFDNINFRSIPSTANDLQVSCDLFNKRLTFAVQVSGCVLTVTNPNWSEVELIQNIMQRGLGAMAAITGETIKNQTTVLVIHLKAKGKSRLELTERFRPPIGLPVKRESAFGFCVYGDDISWLIDLSAVYPDAVFVRIFRIFEASIPIEEISKTLYNDEHELLGLMELSIE